MTTETTTTTSLTITSREQYLAYRAQWKADYKELSATIRKNKLLLKDSMRKGFDTGRLHYDLSTGKITARTMLETLAVVKDEARAHTAKMRAQKAEAVLA